MSPNETAIRAFADQFTPPLTVCPTERINDVALPDAWTANHWDAATNTGVSGFAFAGQFKAYIEITGPSSFAGSAGRFLAAAIGRDASEKRDT